jgi:microcystin degradation protein MlrC
MLRIGIGGIVHEASTFSTVRFGPDEIRACPFHDGQAVIERAATLETAIPGFLQLDDPEVEWVPLLTSFAPSGGQLTVAGYEWLRDQLFTRIRAAGHLDGCLLSLHGGMVIDHPAMLDADGILLQELRGVLPVGCRLAGTMDMHATVTPRMVEHADLLMAYQTFPPHWDKHDIGLQLARLLVRSVRGEIDPVMGWSKPPMLLQPESHDSRRPPMQSVLAEARAAAQRPGMLAVSMVCGFGWCDVPDAGASVLTIADDDRQLAQETAAELAQFWFDRRDQFVVELVPIAEAVTRAARAVADSATRPVLLCDQADNTGAGGSGDSTALLAELLKQGVTNAALGAICDAAAVATCVAAGVGHRVRLSLGEKLNDRGASPLEVEGRVKTLSDGQYRNSGTMWIDMAGDLGRAATVTVDGVDVIIVEKANSAWDPAVFVTLGIDPRVKSIVAIKSQIFGLEGFAGLYSEFIDVDGEGWGTTNFRRLPYERVRRPISPLDTDVSFAARSAVLGAV